MSPAASGVKIQVAACSTSGGWSDRFHPIDLGSADLHAHPAIGHDDRADMKLALSEARKATTSAISFASAARQIGALPP